MKLVLERKPPTEEQLRQYESEIGAKLPLDYRSWLLAHGGGRPVETLLPEVQGERFDVSEFFSLSHVPGVDLSERFQESVGLIPKGKIPIGMSLGNDLVVLDLLSGSVSYLPVQSYLGKPFVERCDLIFCAESFALFCASLEEDTTNYSAEPE